MGTIPLALLRVLMTLRITTHEPTSIVCDHEPPNSVSTSWLRGCLGRLESSAQPGTRCAGIYLRFSRKYPLVSRYTE